MSRRLRALPQLIWDCGNRATQDSTTRGPRSPPGRSTQVRGIANFIRCVVETVPTSARSQPIWTLPERHLPLFKQVLSRLGIQSLRLASAGLRSVGATDFWLRTRDIPALRRRGRWSNERTLERYRQEGSYFLRSTYVPADTDARLDSLVALAPVRLSHRPLQHLLSFSGVEVVLTGCCGLSGQIWRPEPGSQQSRHSSTHSLRWAELKKRRWSCTPDATRSTANYWDFAAVSVSSEGPAPLHVGSVSVGVASVWLYGSPARVWIPITT